MRLFYMCFIQWSVVLYPTTFAFFPTVCDFFHATRSSLYRNAQIEIRFRAMPLVAGSAALSCPEEHAEYRQGLVNKYRREVMSEHDLAAMYRFYNVALRIMAAA